MAIFTFAVWWGLLRGGALCARAHCAHWKIRPWDDDDDDDDDDDVLIYLWNNMHLQCHCRSEVTPAV